MKPLPFLALSAVFASSAFAQLPSVAIAAADNNTCNLGDVQTKLISTGRFSSVDILDVMTTSPTLIELTAYDAVISWSNLTYSSGSQLGDVLADYVDAGGGVVMAVFATSTTTPNRFLTGRWASGGYEVIQSQSGNLANAQSLGAIVQPGHPLMAGVNTLSASLAFRATTTTLVQGSIVAEWGDGSILAAVGTMPGRVDLGVFPPSSDCSSTYWDAFTDGGILVANALELVAREGLDTTTFCDPANNNSTGLPTVLTAANSMAATSGVHLDASQGPANQFGYFLLGTAAADPGLILGGGEFCLAVGGSNQFVRYNVPGGIWNSVGQFDGSGQFQNSVGTSSIGTGFDLPGNVPVLNTTIQAGDTYHFQLWHREGGGSSNFSNGMSITF